MPKQVLRKKTILKLADRKTQKWIILKLKRKMEIFIMFNTSIKTEETRELYHTSSGEVGGGGFVRYNLLFRHRLINIEA